MYFKYRPDLRILAQKNRCSPTLAEEKIWYVVLSCKKLGYKFLRQKPISSYIVDFYCSKLKLVIEIDGDEHAERAMYDEKRTKDLEKLGLKVVRYYNLDVLKHIREVYDDMLVQVEVREEELKK